MIIGKINDKVLIDDLVFREEEHKRIMYVNEMEDYLYNHNYISKNKDKDPFRQQELSQERASCIVQKYRTLTEEKDKEIERLNNIIDELEKELEQEIAVVGANRTVDNNNPEWWYKLNCYNNILSKLKELKEGK